MGKTSKKRVFAGAVAALILAGSVPIISTTSTADNENDPSVNNGQGGNVGDNAAYTEKKTLDDFSTYADSNALNDAYELFDN